MAVTLFFKFLTARILERIQQISKEVCRGCLLQYKYANLHPCETNSLFQRVELFLPSAKGEALDKLIPLLRSFRRNFTLFVEENTYLEEGHRYILDLEPHLIIDSSYLNEESEARFGLGSDWREPDTLTQLFNSVLDNSSDTTREQDELEQIYNNAVDEEIIDEYIEPAEIFPKEHKHSDVQMEDYEAYANPNRKASKDDTKVYSDQMEFDNRYTNPNKRKVPKDLSKVYSDVTNDEPRAKLGEKRKAPKDIGPIAKKRCVDSVNNKTPRRCAIPVSQKNRQTKRRKSIHKAACDDSSCCRDI